MSKKIETHSLHFVRITLSLSAILIMMIIYYIITTTFTREEDAQFQKAFDWQVRENGVVGITDQLSEVYKQKMTDYMVSKKPIDTLLFGSSTLMAVKSSMIKEHTLFNAAKNSNPLFDSVSKAKYYIATYKKIKYVIMGFDWALGKPYQKYEKMIYEPSEVKDDNISITAKIKDAVSYQRVKIVASNLYANLLKRPEVYQCPTEDTLGSDSFFPPLVPRNCHGFRVDGSATFSNQRRLNEKEGKSVLDAGLKEYRKMLSDSHGKIEPGYLEDLQIIDETLKKRGGKLIILIPPLIPGATELIKKSEDGAYLKETMDTVVAFTATNHIDIVDASASENFGCASTEFMDAHHAFAECIEKIIDTLSF